MYIKKNVTKILNTRPKKKTANMFF